MWSLAFAIQYVYHLSDVACSINDPNGKQIISPRMLQRIDLDVAYERCVALHQSSPTHVPLVDRRPPGVQDRSTTQITACTTIFIKTTLLSPS